MKFLVRKCFFLGLCILLKPAIHAQLGTRSLATDEPIYSHQYTFLGSDKYFFIDTTFNSLHWYHQFNHRGQDNFDYLTLGSMGTPLNRVTVPESVDIWHYYSYGAYQPYFQKQQRIPFYYARSPITEANYWMGYDRGQSFNIYHTQNINPHWNFLINYSRLNDLGFYTHNRNIKSRLLANTGYENPSVGYEAHAYFLLEKMLTEENGGMLDYTELSAPGARVLRNVNLLEDERTIRDKEFFIDQNYAINKLFENKGDSLNPDVDSLVSGDKIALGHTFRFKESTNVYNGRVSDNFYQDYFQVQSGTYSDSTGYKSFSNTVYLLTEVGREIKFDLKAGIKSLVTEYGNSEFRFTDNNWGLTGNVGGAISDRIRVKGELDYILTGNLRESFSAKAEGQLKILKWLRAFGGYEISSRYPDFFESVYFSNNYIWENSFSKEVINRFNYGVGWGKGNLFEITNFIANDYVYFNENVQPTQSGEPVNVFRAKLVQNFTLWNFIHQDNQVYYQKVGGNAAILPLPELVTRNSLYFEFHLFKRVLKCLAGAELNYFTAYNSPSYDPATGRFYVANERSIGDYPLIDVFANFELRSARFFVKYEHVNEGLSGYNYFAAPNYPFPDRVLRIGITWRFFN